MLAFQWSLFKTISSVALHKMRASSHLDQQLFQCLICKLFIWVFLCSSLWPKGLPLNPWLEWQPSRLVKRYSKLSSFYIFYYLLERWLSRFQGGGGWRWIRRLGCISFWSWHWWKKQRWELVKLEVCWGKKYFKLLKAPQTWF